MPNDCPTYNFKQTLFLGCSVERFAATLGWNEQPTTVNVTIVRDTCPGPKVYYDPYETEFTAADPGFRIYGESGSEPPEIGAPVFFKFGEFEFCGLIQNWQQIEPSSGTEIYEVTLASPVELLQGTVFALSEYAGAMKGFNIFNVYGFLEWAYGNPGTTFTQSPVDGVMFGSVAEGFGGADLTEAGISWNKVRQAISILTSSIPLANTGPVEVFSQYGRVCFIGAARGGYGLVGYDSINVSAGGAFAYAKYISEYYLDLSSLPFSTTDIRIPGPTADLLTILSQVTQEMAHDYYVELKLVPINGIVSKVIKIRPISRQFQPTLGVVEDFVNAIGEGGVISSSFGRELRNEATTNFLVGGQKRSIYQVENGIPLPGADPDFDWLATNYPDNTYVRDTVVPYYGKDFYGNVFVVDDDGFITMSSDGLKQSLTAIGASMPPTIKISINEILQAGAGYSQFTSYLRDSGRLNEEDPQRLGNIIIAYDPSFRGGFDAAYDLPGGEATAAALQLQPRDVVQTINVNYVDEINRDVKKIFDFVAGMYAVSRNTVMVRMPYVNAKRVLTTEGDLDELLGGRLITSDRPCEGGWSETTDIIGLANPGGIIDYFKNEDGTIHSFASFAFTNGLNLDLVGDGYKYYFQEVNPGQYIFFAEVQVQDEIVFLDNANARSPRVVVELPDLREAAIFSKDDQFNAQQAVAQINATLQNIDANVEKELWKCAVEATAFEPYKLAIAFESNENTYGPWKPDNIIEAGPPGKINFIKDESLNPWTYGNYANMDTVAQLRVNESVGGMQAVENGQIQIDGLPAVLLGAELAYSSVNDLFASLSNDTETIAVTTEFRTLSYNIPFINRAIWTGSSGPNVNNINMQIGAEGVTTTYEFRTFSPKFGTLGKYNANQLSQRLVRENKLNSKQRFLQSINAVQSANAKRLSSKKSKSSKGKRQEISANEELGENQPASVMVAQVANFRKDADPEDNPTQVAQKNKVGRKRTIVASKPIHALGHETSSEAYDTKAVMSWDGFMRPVSLNGSGGLPRMARATSEAVYDTGTGAENTITNLYLNFLANPSGHEYSELDSLHTGLDGGHDIEIVGRSNFSGIMAALTGENATGTGNSVSMVIPANASSGQFVDDYQDDYRFMALRGPLWMQAWCYDTNGKPIPNEVDTMEAMESGIYATEGLTNRFHPDWLKKPQTWPVAPIDIRFNRERGVFEAGTGGGGGADVNFVLVCEDLPGYSFNGLNATPVPVRALLRTLDFADTGSFLVDDGDEFINVYPVENVAVSMSNASCCGGSNTGSDPGPGLYINSPMGGDNRLTNTEATSLMVTGGGVYPTSNVNLYITDGVATGTFQSSFGDIIVNSDGTWALISPTNISTFNRGTIKLTAEEIYLDTTLQAPRSIVIEYAKNYSTANINYYVTQQPQEPDLDSSSDTGSSTTDNLTADNQPYIRHTLTAFPDGGFNIAVYIDGVFNRNILSTDPVLTSLDVGDVCLFQIAGTLTPGQHSIQTQEWYATAVDGDPGQPTQIYGPISNPLYVTYDPDEIGSLDPETGTGGELYGKTGQIVNINGVSFLTSISPCNVQLTTYLSDRINNLITATCIASATFDAMTGSVGYEPGSFVIINPTINPDPTIPGVIDLTDTSLIGSAGDEIRLRYYNSAWQVRDVKSL